MTMTNRIALAAALAVLLAAPLAAVAADGIATLRGNTPLDREAEPPRMPRVQNDDIKRMRSYPEQPPTIPHQIDGYQVDKNGNRCLACHARTRVAESQAPMISITHYMDRDGQFLADVSPRRYFCNQCHVPQTEAAPLVDNTFIDIDTILKAEQLDRTNPK